MLDFNVLAVRASKTAPKSSPATTKFPDAVHQFALPTASFDFGTNWSSYRKVPNLKQNLSL